MSSLQQLLLYFFTISLTDFKLFLIRDLVCFLILTAV